MDNRVIVHKGRTCTVHVDLGMDVSDDTFSSEIRSGPDVKSPLIATWQVGFVTDGADGLVALTIDDLETSQITANSGYMDLKRMVGTEPVPVFDKPLEVIFRGSVTE